MDLDWVKLELDVASIDHACFVPDFERVTNHGIVLTTLSALGDVESNRRRLFELNRECSADIPGRGAFHTWEEYRARRLEVSSFDPDGVVIALDSDSWVAMSAVSRRADRDYSFNEMTGVVRTHRRRGLALATKLATFGIVEGWRRTTVRTVHHPENTAMIALNRKLGYKTATWAYPPV